MLLRGVFARDKGRIDLVGLVAHIHEVLLFDPERTVIGVDLADDFLATGIYSQVVDVAQLVEVSRR